MRYRRTADESLLETIRPNLERALHWIDTYGDADGDSFVEYAPRSPHSLTQQGWKDSGDSVFHADGSLAGPLWYLYFRLVDNASEDKARAEAARLGLKNESSTAGQALWTTLQTIVSAPAASRKSANARRS